MLEFFLKQAFHCLKQMLLLIVVGNGQRIERPLARRKQVAFSKVDLMCFFTCQQQNLEQQQNLQCSTGISDSSNGALRCQWQAAFETLDSLDSPDLSRGDDGNQVTAQRCLSGMKSDAKTVLAVFFGANRFVRYAKNHVKQ